jgi:acetate kinase
MTGTGEHASQAGDSGLVLVLNSGSSSVKFALVNPGSGQRVTDGLAEQVGTPEAVLRTRRSPDADEVVTERLADGSYRAIIARILGDLPGAGPPGIQAGNDQARLTGVGHRVVHGGERSPDRCWWMTR